MEYFYEPIPSPTDEQVSRLIQLLGDSTLGEREQVLYSWPETWHLQALTGFAVRMSSLAVRLQSRDLLMTALLAIVFEGFRVDYRDGGIQALAVAYDTAGKLGEAPTALFDEAAAYARPEMAGHMRDFLARTDLANILEIMRFREGEDAGGFRYEFAGWPPLPIPSTDP